MSYWVGTGALADDSTYYVGSLINIKLEKRLKERINNLRLGEKRGFRRSPGWTSSGIALLLVAAAVSVWGAKFHYPKGISALRVQYLILLAVIFMWMAVVGKAFNGRFEGLLIDGRNTISLSRLQLFVWLVIVGCAFTVEVVHNFGMHTLTPDDVGVPTQLSLVMGMATTSFVATPAILNLKTRGRPSALDVANGQRVARARGAQLNSSSGRLFSRNLSEKALWADLFRGEELATAGSADPAKVQQFLITFVISAIYITTLWRDMGTIAEGTIFRSLPGIGQGGLLLMGASHAAYLGAKATPQSPYGTSLSIPRVDTAPQLQASITPPPAVTSN